MKLCHEGQVCFNICCSNPCRVTCPDGVTVVETLSECPDPVADPLPFPDEGPDQDCMFDPSLPKCAEPPGGCPEGFGLNEDGNCFPRHYEGCPDGYHSHENDESGKCIPDDVPCEPGYIMAPDYPECQYEDQICEGYPDLDECQREPPNNCDASYPDNCIPSPPPDLNCGDDGVPSNFRVIGDDPHSFDGDNDGIGCESNGNGNGGNGNGNGDDNDIDIRIKTVIKNIDIHKTIHNTADFPDVDIIGLSIKDMGDAIVCIMNIDNDWVQCQEFGVTNERINENIWRVIETDSDRDYDDANTRSDDVDDAINAIKSQDFSELDTNHDFNVDLAALGINTQGDGLICLIEDDRNEGTGLCEPFKISNTAVSGQITEITEFD